MGFPLIASIYLSGITNILSITNELSRSFTAFFLFCRYQEQVKLAKYYKAAHIKHPQWIMEHKHEINQTLTGLWNARKKREERRKFLEERNARRAREKAERDGLLTDLKLAVKTGNDTIDNSRKKL